MELVGEHTFEAPREVVWEAIMNPEVLANILPGCERLEQVAENLYEGTLNVRVGPVQGRFTGTVTLSDLKEPDSFRMEIDGQGPAGFVKGGGEAHLQMVDGKTLLRYAGEAQVGGRIASVGQRLLDTSARSITRQGLESLERLMAARQQPEPGVEVTEGEPTPVPVVPELAPPSEAEVALNLARDIFDEYVPAEYRPYVIGAGMATLTLLLFWLLRKLLGR